MKKENIKLIDTWITSDFNLEMRFTYKRKAYVAIFESNAWYDHMNGGIRHLGDKRRLTDIVVVSSKNQENTQDIYDLAKEILEYHEIPNEEFLIQILRLEANGFNF